MMEATKVLIVEDEAVVRLHLEQIVAQMGLRVSGTAASAAEALAEAEREPPGLALIDINLDGEQDGIDAAWSLRRRHDCAVIFATAYADEETIARTARLGAVGYVVKPFTNAGMRAAIATALAGREDRDRREGALVSALLGTAQAVLVVDDEGTISFANPEAERLTGSASREVCGRRLVDALSLADDRDEAALTLSLRQAVVEGAPQELPEVGITVGEARHTVDISVEPLADRTPGGAGAVVAIREVRSEAAPAPTEAVRRARPGRFGAGTRMLFYSHDTFGLGHLQRSSNLIRTLLHAHPEMSALLVTGSPVVHRYELPQGADYVKLPAVQKVGSERYEPRSLRIPSTGIQSLRRNLLLRTIRDYDPQVLLVDHAPVGMNGELLPALEWLASHGGCRRILGLRDITDAPGYVREHWRERGIYEVMRDLYDDIVVYGTRDVYDLVSEYALPNDVAAKTHFVGYVREPDGVESVVPRPSARPVVAVSIGGGDGADGVIEAVLEMLHAFPEEIHFDTEILTGPLLCLERTREFRERAVGLPVDIAEFMPSTSAWFGQADLVVSTGGYNTTTQLLAHARRAIVVPRVLHRQEQLIRARRLEELGLVACVHPKDLTPRRLLEAIRDALASEDEPLTSGRAARRIALDGAERMAAFCGALELS